MLVPSRRGKFLEGERAIRDRDLRLVAIKMKGFEAGGD